MIKHFKKYTIGIRSTNGEFQYFKPPFYEFWADPFIIERDDKLFIFFEVFNYFRNKGHISYSVYNPTKKKLSKVNTLLKKEYHLSYPQVFKYKGEYYMIPESRQNRNVSIYRFTKFPNTIKFESNLMTNVSNVDTTMLIEGSDFYLFTNPRSDNNQKDVEKLEIYHSTNLNDKYIKIEDVLIEKNDKSNARMAGNILTIDNSMYRVSQNCQNIYGEHMNLNKIHFINSKKYNETFVGKFELGIKEPHHTYNKTDNYEVIDIVKYSSLIFIIFTIIYRIPFMIMRKLFRKLKK